MSGSGGNRKSMDDVLASIRRIIGAEKKDGYDDLPDTGDAPAPQDPLTLGAPIRRGDPDKSRPEPAHDPLSLTPNMRVDFSKLTQDEGTRIAPAPVAAAPSPARAVADRFAAPEPEDDAVVIDEAALEDMIRRIVREELDTRAAEDDREDVMRRVVREELGGETGQAISRNVLKLIQAEVARLLRDRG